MTGLEKLKAIDKDVYKFMRWYITHDKKRLRMACKAGGVKEVIQETCVAICKISSEFSCEWTTAGARQIDWTIAKLLAMQNAKKRRSKAVEIDFEIQDGKHQHPLAKLHVDELKQAVNYQIGKLPHRLAEVLRMHLDGVTVKDISVVLGVSYTRALQLYHKSIRKLSELNEANKLVFFID